MKFSNILGSTLPLLGLAAALDRSTFVGYSGVSYSVPSADANSVAVDQVSAEWNVPTLCLPDGGDPSKDYFMASWIGFMANGCEGVRGALLQAGVTNTRKADGTNTAAAWVEWYPRAAEFKDSKIQVNPGDTVAFIVEASSRTNGLVTITNKSTGQTIQEAFESPDPSDPASNLCTGDSIAYGVIETTGAAGADPSFFPAFSDITFSDFEAVARTDQQAYNMDSAGAVIYDLQNGDTYATSERTSTSQFLIHSSKTACAA
ncbi:putative aspergillopepsin-2 protein [Eutypa lata UCREL1]|uniref:Putative aspergillopepsin-2 protein n=1 Tax=Eutypa lata (strain UCR-EL1) TaxID=1287681 RepID=M7SHJ3_EUTLA|nr:putative aspergillopepsin-2 protein [Eutypa lata UCREL1]